MEKFKIIATPMEISCNLDKHENGKSVRERKYWSMIGSLLYLTTSHLNIMFVGYLWSHFQTCKKNHIPVQSNTSWDISLTHTNGFMVSQ